MLPLAVRLPAITAPPPTVKLPPVIVPVTVSALVLLSNVKLAVALAVPESLNMTCVFEPGADKFPVILPTTLPTKVGATTLPLAVIVP